MKWNIFKRSKPAQQKRRSFDAAQTGRLFQNLPTTTQSIDWDLRVNLYRLRTRSRHFSVNNPYGRKFMNMCATNIIGPSGMSLVVRVTETDAKGKQQMDGLASTAIEKAFADWSKKGNCDVTGYHSFFDLQNLAVKALARDGECLIRKVYGKGYGTYGFQLQILDVDRLDWLLNVPAGANGVAIKMGVEIDKYGKPLAYHLLSHHPSDTQYYTASYSTRERVPAEDVYHLFIADRPEQNRGIPWMHAAMVQLGNLGGYEEAAIIAARVGAAKMGFFTTPDGDGAALSTGTDDNGNLLTEADAGVFGVLPEGYDFTPFNPDYPHAMYADFVKAALRGISSGLGVSYNGLANDLEGVNFSSIRAGVLEEREIWMALQNFLIETLMNDLFSTWLKWALLSRAIILPNGSALPIAKYDKFNQAAWKGRRWQWVDPVKDIEANVAAVNNGFKSRTEVVAEQGKDIDDVLAQLAEEQAMIKALDIEIQAVNPNHPNLTQTDGAQNGGSNNGTT